MSRAVKILSPATLLLVALVALVVALQYGGGADAPSLGTDPGPVVRFGLPVAKLFVDLGTAITIGALAIACFALSRDDKAFGTTVDIAAASAAVWAVSSLAASILTLPSLGVAIAFDDRFGDSLAAFLSTIGLGQAWLATTLIAATITVVCFAVRNQVVLAMVTAGALLGLLPLAEQGHAGGTADHDNAVTSLWIHVAAVSVWVGGLVTLAMVRPRLGRERLARVLPRYSSLAVLCFILVAVSGYVRAEISVGTLDRLLTPYGVLVVVKVAALIALGAFGAAHRSFLIRRIAASDDSGARYFWWLAGAEVAFMGLATGVAVALARTATPVPEVPASEFVDPTPAEILTGRPLPPQPDFERYMTTWQPDLIWVLVCVFGAVFYLAGVRRLRRRGDSWPVLRTASWLAGLVLLFYITNGGINAYQEYLFSAHMLAHMVLGMMVPLLLVPGAPVTLLLRTVRKRDDGSRGVREWAMWAVHSRYAAVLANPIVAASIFAGSLWLFYYTPLFSWAITEHIGHHWMVVHFLIAGYLFVQSLIGVDPVPYRAPFPMRILLLLGTMAFHAFFGISIMSNEALLLADWYGAMGHDWGSTAIEDQQIGGAIAWGVGEIPTAVLAVIVAVQWARSDEREARRRDRVADRDGDAELAAYNEMLAERARRDS